MKKIIASMLVAIAVAARAQPPPENDASTQMPVAVRPLLNSDFMVVGMNLQLPADQRWDLDPLPAKGSVKEMYLYAMPEAGPGTYALTALVKNGTKKVTVSASGVGTDAKHEIVLDLSHVEAAGEELSHQLRVARAWSWVSYATASDSTVLDACLTSVLGTDAAQAWRRRAGSKRPVPTAFSVIGGRAAVQETLQLQDLREAGQGAQDATVPVAGIAGVEVKAHPFAAMLGVAPGGALPLADLAPPDHLFVYMQKPGALGALLGKGVGFLGRASGMAGSGSIDYGLVPRYLARLGVDEKWLKGFLASGAVTELGLVAPDLYFIDGTEVTVLARVKNGKELAAQLAGAGVKALADGGTVTRELASGRKVMWALRKDVLVASTSAVELDAVLALEKAAGQGSLGRSAEFRYMLTQLPVKAETRMYGYLSDPFIRHLVSPAVKIGQLRRVNARADLEYLTGCALLARVEGVQSVTVTGLVQAAYVPERFATVGYSMDDKLVARSATWGSAAEMRSLTDVPATNASPSEVEAYKQYLENYNHYWRQYFDPIAVRLDDAAGGALEATTFILPLIDSSVYNALREYLKKDGAKQVLDVPKITPKPLVMLSLGLSQKSWDEVRKGLFGILRDSGIMPGADADLGPGLHLAVLDGSPVIAMGSGDLLGAFGADTRLGGAEGMLFAPVLLSILTRPCELFIETRHPDATRELLGQAIEMMAGRMGREMGVAPSSYKVTGRDEWIYSVSFFGMIKMRYALEVRDRYLVIRNIPWSPRPEIAGVEPAAQGDAQLDIVPSAAKLELAGLFTSSEERNREAAFNGMGYLFPLLASGYTDAAGADAACERLLGFKPVHPDGGRWVWDGTALNSSVYGSPRAPTQPAYAAGNEEFGLFGSIDRATVGMQFEDTGLRTTLRWTTR